MKGRSRRVIRENVEDGIGPREKREISPDVVGDWIRQDEVFEPAGGDFIIVGRVTPSTNTRVRIIKEVGVVQIMRIWMKIVNASPVMSPVCNWADST